MGAKVTGYSVDVPTNPSLFHQLNLKERMIDIVADIRSLKDLTKSLKEAEPEIIFHLAAQPLVRFSYDDPRSTFEVNVMGTVNLLEAIRQVPSVRSVVVVTSDKVYDNIGWEYGYRENDRLGGGDPYSFSKACSELVTASYHRAFYSGNSKAKIASARAGNVIGGGDYAMDRIIPDCVRAWNENRTVLIRHPESIRPWQHVLEPLSGYLLLAQEVFEQNSNCIGEAFNFGPPAESCKSVRVLVEALRSEWPTCRWEVTQEDLTRPESKYLRLSCELSFKRLGWKPRLSFDESVKLSSHWYRTTLSDSRKAHNLTVEQIERYLSILDS